MPASILALWPVARKVDDVTPDAATWAKELFDLDPHFWVRRKDLLNEVANRALTLHTQAVAAVERRWQDQVAIAQMALDARDHWERLHAEANRVRSGLAVQLEQAEQRVDAAVRAENEACEKIAESIPRANVTTVNTRELWMREAAQDIAIQIRARREGRG